MDSRWRRSGRRSGEDERGLEGPPPASKRDILSIQLNGDHVDAPSRHVVEYGKAGQGLARHEGGVGIRSGLIERLSARTHCRLHARHRVRAPPVCFWSHSGRFSVQGLQMPREGERGRAVIPQAKVLNLLRLDPSVEQVRHHRLEV